MHHDKNLKLQDDCYFINYYTKRDNWDNCNSDNLIKSSKLALEFKDSDKSKYFNISEKEFIKQFVNNYKTRFHKFIKKNDSIYKNFFLNEFIKNVEKLFVTPDSFDDLIREIILFLSLSNFLLVCQLFEGKKRLTVKGYGEVLSYSDEENIEPAGLGTVGAGYSGGDFVLYFSFT